MKLLIIVYSIASLATIAWSDSISFGEYNHMDYLLYREDVERKPVKGYFWNAVVKYPITGPSENVNISVIYITDRFANNSGAKPSLRSGGPGHRFAQIFLTTNINRGMKSTVEIFGSHLKLMNGVKKLA